MAQDRKKQSLWPSWLLTISEEAETSTPSRGVISKLKKGRTLSWGYISPKHYFKTFAERWLSFFKLHVLYSVRILFQMVSVKCGCLNRLPFVCVLRCVWLCSSVGLSLPGSSVQATILEWVAIPSTRALSDPGIEPVPPAFPALADRFFTTEPPKFKSV